MTVRDAFCQLESAAAAATVDRVINISDLAMDEKICSNEKQIRYDRESLTWNEKLTQAHRAFTTETKTKTPISK